MPATFTPKFVDLVRTATATQGTGPILPGAAVPGFSSFAENLSAGDQFYYCVQGIDKPTEREVGRGTLQANGTITRDPLSGTPTSFSSGAKSVALVTAAEWFRRIESGAGASAGIAPVATRTLLAQRAATTGASVFLNEAGREGIFVFEGGSQAAKVARDPFKGVHIAPLADASGATGVWTRKFDGPLSVRWFGAVGDDVTNDGPAVLAALAFLNATATAQIGYGAGRLLFPRTPAKYYLGTTTLDLPSAIVIEGENGTDGGGNATILRWDDATGIRVQRYNTSGATAFDSVPHNGGDCAVVRHISLQGNATNTGFEGEFHGIQLRARALIENVSIYNFKGNGIHVFAAAGAGPAGGEGNVNNFAITNVTVQACRNGLFVDGPDANAGVVTKLNATSCRRWGILDSSFLGNTYVGCHADSNAGFDGGMAYGVLGGNMYTVVHGSEAAASTNAPSGTTVSNAWWSYVAPGTAIAGYGQRAWISGMSWRSGGAYCSDDINAQTLFLGCYSEGGQPPSQMNYPAMVLGGQHSASVIRIGYGTAYGGWLMSGQIDGLSVATDFKAARDIVSGRDLRATGSLYVANGASITGNLTATGSADARAAAHFLGPTTGGANSALYLRNAGSFSTIYFQANGSPDAQIDSIFGDGLAITGSTRVRLGYGSTYGFGYNANGFGYLTGVGGAVTQAGSKTAAVTLNKTCGQVILNGAALAAGASASFPLNCSAIAATDVVQLSIASGATADAYQLCVTATSAGFCRVQIRNVSAGSLAEAIVLNFAILKAVAA